MSTRGPLPSDALLARLAPVRAVRGAGGLLAHQAPDVFALWQAWEDECGGRALLPPFWAVAWPAAIVLSRAVLDGLLPVAGARVLEIGCGGAVTAIAAAQAGASAVEANDLDGAALHVAARNAEANAVALRLTAADYSTEGPVLDADIVLIADLFYERVATERLMPRLRELRATRGVEVFVADGGRPFAPREDVVLLREETLEVDRDLEGVAQRSVRLLRLA